MANHSANYYADGNLVRAIHTDEPEKGLYGTFTTAASQDVEPIIDGNVALREAQTGKEQFRLVARVPVIIYEQAVREGWANDDAAWKRWLNNHDNKPFRVWEGAV